MTGGWGQRREDDDADGQLERQAEVDGGDSDVGDGRDEVEDQSCDDARHGTRASVNDPKQLACFAVLRADGGRVVGETARWRGDEDRARWARRSGFETSILGRC